MTADVLDLAETILTGLIEEPAEVRRARRKNPQAVGGPLWSVDLPGSRDLVRRVIQFAETKQVTVDGPMGQVTGRLKTATATMTHLVVDVEADAVVNEGMTIHGTATAKLKYKTDLQRTLATGGQWTFHYWKTPVARLRLNRLIPELKPTAYGAELNLDVEIERPAVFGGWKRETLKHVELHYTHARAVMGSGLFGGWLKTKALPDIKFLPSVLLALMLASAPADVGAGEVRRAKKIGRALAKPIRSQGRADAGYPFWSTAENVSGIALRLLTPVRWLF